MARSSASSLARSGYNYGIGGGGVPTDSDGGDTPVLGGETCIGGDTAMDFDGGDTGYGVPGSSAPASSAPPIQKPIRKVAAPKSHEVLSRDDVSADESVDADALMEAHFEQKFPAQRGGNAQEQLQREQSVS